MTTRHSNRRATVGFDLTFDRLIDDYVPAKSGRSVGRVAMFSWGEVPDVYWLTEDKWTRRGRPPAFTLEVRLS